VGVAVWASRSASSSGAAGRAFRLWALYAAALVGLSLASGSFGAIGPPRGHGVSAGLPSARRPSGSVGRCSWAGVLVNAVLTLALVRYYPDGAGALA
jgi:hypothetical protein